MFAASARTQAGGHYEGPDYSASTFTLDDGAGHSWPLSSDLLYYYNGGVGYGDVYNLSFNMSATFTWVPDADTPDAPPPDKAYFRETASAYAGDHFIYGGDNSPEPPTANDGLQDEAVLTTEDISPYFIDYGDNSSGSHLKQKSGASITFTPSLSASWAGQPNNCGNDLFYSVSSLGQFLINSTIDASYHKSSNPDLQTANCDFPAQNLRDLSDYTITGDSVAIWAPILGGHWIGDNTYTATDLGFNQPTWTWTPGGSILAGISNIVDAPSQHLVFDFGTDTNTVLSQTTTTSCNVTDSNGANASNTYTVNWHYPYEKTADIDSVAMKAVQQTLIEDVHAGDIATIPEAQGGDIDIAAGIDGIAAGTALSGQEEAAGILELLASGAGLADLKFHYGGESEHTQGAFNGQDKWDATRRRSEWAENVSPQSLLTHRDPDTEQFDGWSYCDMSICLVKRYHHKRWYADNYGANGFVSSQHIMHTDPIDKIEEEPFYTKVADLPASWPTS